MNLYAVRDLLIDYFRAPFAGPDDKAVLTAMATLINDRTNANDEDIKTAPAQFEIWKLATINAETGDVTPAKVRLANCAGLVRTSFRPEPDGIQRPTRETQNAAPEHPRTPPGAPRDHPTLEPLDGQTLETDGMEARPPSGDAGRGNR